jgi:hypothetical protein
VKRAVETASGRMETSGRALIPLELRCPYLLILPKSELFVNMLEEAVSSAGPCACVNRIAAVLSSQPNRLQVPLASVAGRFEAARDKPLGCSEHAEPERGSIRSVRGDLFGGLHPGTPRVRNGRERVLRESRLSRVGDAGFARGPANSGRALRKRSTQSLTRPGGGVKEKTNRCRVVSKGMGILSGKTGSHPLPSIPCLPCSIRTERVGDPGGRWEPWGRCRPHPHV